MAIDVANLIRLRLPPTLPIADQVEIARIGLDIAENAIKTGSRAGLFFGPLDFEGGRIRARDDLQAFINRHMGTGGILTVFDPSPLLVSGDESTAEVSRLVIKAAVEYNAVLEGLGKTDAAIDQIWVDVGDRISEITHTVVETIGNVASVAFDVTKWVVIGAAAIAAIVFAPELKAAFKAVT